MLRARLSVRARAEPLLQAAKDGNLAKAEEALGEGADVNCTDEVRVWRRIA